ncbi:MAG TPA: helix-turn-helix domain-containing protein [bacterium]|nr:helix-turn-helix domain-containing protein [bacterium]
MNKPLNEQKEAVQPVAPSQSNMQTINLDMFGNDDLLVIKEVAAILRVSVMTVRRFVESKYLNVYRLGGCLRFKPRDIKDFIERAQSERIKTYAGKKN